MLADDRLKASRESAGLAKGLRGGSLHGPMRFEKYHALGNDYLVCAPGKGESPLLPATVRAVCHRHYGLGSDGVLFGPVAAEGGAFGLRIFNPDGSEAEKSGNGLRIFARSLVDSGRVGEEVPFDIETPGGRVRAIVHPGRTEATVEMGRVSFHSAEIPVAGEAREVLDEAISVAGEPLRYAAATLGNPHCVLFFDAVDEALARRLGPLLETDSRFPNRTNVQFARVIDEQTLQIEIWERGAGYTLASGTSASAAAAVARKLGRTGPEVTVRMPGGTAQVSLGEGFAVTLRGGVTYVGRVEISEEGLAEAKSRLG